MTTSPCGRFVEFETGARALTLRRFGVVKETAAPNKLMIDLDLPDPYSRDWARPGHVRRLPLSIARGVLPLRVIRAVCSIVGVRVRDVRHDRTARGFHVVVMLRDRMTRAEIVAIQAVLGSDSKREALNLMRARSIRLHGCPREFRDRWNLLFERKLATTN